MTALERIKKQVDDLTDQVNTLTKASSDMEGEIRVTSGVLFNVGKRLLDLENKAIIKPFKHLNKESEEKCQLQKSN